MAGNSSGPHGASWSQARAALRDGVVGAVKEGQGVTEHSLAGLSDDGISSSRSALPGGGGGEERSAVRGGAARLRHFRALAHRGPGASARGGCCGAAATAAAAVGCAWGVAVFC